MTEPTQSDDDTAAIPTLNEQVTDVDLERFNRLPVSPAANIRAPASGPDLERRIKAVVDAELRNAVEYIKTSIVAEVKDAMQKQNPPPTDAAMMATANESSEQVAETVQPPEPLPKAYEPAGLETRWYQTWQSAGYFAPGGAGEPYAIALPPPNVTGSLHMGHAFQDTLMDALIRFQRMDGRNTLWQTGTDHAGIATQMVVERNLALKGIKREELGREKFEQAVWEWKAESGGTITGQLRRMGASMDWSRERFTLDDGLSRAVRDVFVQLYHEGLIYRGQRLVNWDPVLGTAISDIEVESQEEQGHMWHFRYPLADGSGEVVVATTRPETMLGDTAVAVHPEDPRYQRVIGKQVRLPLCDRLIPVIADDYVDPEFGSGCVKITPAHDFNDYEVGQRHDLPMINIFTKEARISDNAPAAYRGMDRYDARKRVVADLQEQGFLVRIDDHKLMVPRCERSQAVVEPFLTDQWYVKIAPLAEPAIHAVETGRIRFVPDNWSKTYYEWMRNIQDWCISRQLWWGHRIPAWYDAAGQVYVGVDEDDARARGGVADDVVLTRDPDVLDTWFSSALWPFSTLGWPEQTPELRTFYPTSVLVTGFDIIFFWVARMIMMGLKFAGDVPFREVYIHGLVRDAEGQKMSKSRGNVLDPLDLIDGIDLESLVRKRTSNLMRPEDAPRIEAATRRQFPDGIPPFGTDALRFTFAALATQGRDIKFDLGRIDGYRNFCNKLWNATRFVLLMTESNADQSRQGEAALGLPERWIRTRLQRVITIVRDNFEAYRFDLAAQTLYEFVWDDFCDWYLELAKVDLNDRQRNPSLQRGTRRTLLEVLESALRLLHPIMPFITEETWQRVAPVAGRSGPTIMLQPYPVADETLIDANAEAALQWVQQAILGIRRIRSEMNIEPKRQITALFSGGDERERAWLHANDRYLKSLGRLETLEPVSADAAPESATALAGNTTFLIPLADLIDPVAELKRLDKELERLRGEHKRIDGKLGNESFVAKAPAEVVRKERDKLVEIETALARLEQQRARIEQLT